MIAAARFELIEVAIDRNFSLYKNDQKLTLKDLKSV